VPAAPQPIAFMTQQTISGSDVYGPVHWTESADGGESWSEPQPGQGQCWQHWAFENSKNSF